MGSGTSNDALVTRVCLENTLFSIASNVQSCCEATLLVQEKELERKLIHKFLLNAKSFAKLGHLHLVFNRILQQAIHVLSA